ncbi:MAG: hypothetical protein ACT4PU_05625 [Planctomycetota bacterium]
MCLLSPAATAAPSDPTKAPSGFNAETRPSVGTPVLRLADGRLLRATSVFGNDQLWVEALDGMLSPFAPALGSVAGLAQSPSTGDVVVGDSYFGNEPLVLLSDSNDDGDMLDAGEMQPFPVSLPDLSGFGLPTPFAMTYRTTESGEELYVSVSNPGAVIKFSGGTWTLFAEGLQFAAGLVWDGEALYVANSDLDRFFNFSGRVMVYRDLSADGDALDAGESSLFAGGLSGASALVQASDGSFYLSGLLDPVDFSGSVGRLLPDSDNSGGSDGVDEGWASGFGSFSAALLLEQGTGGFVPGTAGDGRLDVGYFGFDFNPFAGSRSLRSAPHSALALSGTVGNNAVFTLTLSGTPGAGAALLLSLDTTGPTLVGLGDLGPGFTQAHAVLNLPNLDGLGTAAQSFVLHNVPALVGLSIAMQGFTFEAGDVGFSNRLQEVVAP